MFPRLRTYAKYVEDIEFASWKQKNALCPKKVLHLINNGTKAFCSVSKMLFVLDKRDRNLNSDILFFSIE